MELLKKSNRLISGALRAGLVAIGVFLLAIGVLVLYSGNVAGGGNYISMMNMRPIPHNYSNYAWWFAVEVGGGFVSALGLALTVYGALKKVS